MFIAKYAKYLIPLVLFLVIFVVVYKTFRAPEPVGVDIKAEDFTNKKKKSIFGDNKWAAWGKKKAKKAKKSKSKSAKTGGKATAAYAADTSDSGGKSFACKLTYYTSDPKENDGSTKTADGSALNASAKIIAVSKGRWNELKGKQIKLGTLGTYTVKDQCSSCASNQIDVLVGSKSEAMSRGITNTTCSVL
ncbi:hypothetical protein ATCVCanal1_357L [Acanthocystis turfacea Chlorella virus Canal-1]|nr:hypothetical protein ATCVCanal1_357L [Acanthocystis turfacea Chlorella virus Canal-1]